MSWKVTHSYVTHFGASINVAMFPCYVASLEYHLSWRTLVQLHQVIYLRGWKARYQGLVLSLMTQEEPVNQSFGIQHSDLWYNQQLTVCLTPQMSDLEIFTMTTQEMRTGLKPPTDKQTCME